MVAVAALALPAAAQDKIRIGYAISKSGPNATGAGITTLPNYKLWVEDVNAAGGLMLKSTGKKAMLEVAENVVVGRAFGRHQALDGVALRVARGESVVILGANGAGKTTWLKAIGGLQPARPGSTVRLDGADLAMLPPHAIVEAGIALVPEGRGIFADLTVRENLMLGAFARRARAAEATNRDRVLALFPRLAERLDQKARTMSGGEQQMVAVGRALMSSPTMLLLDEPSLGLSPLLCQELFAALARIGAADVGVLLVEQNAARALAVAWRGYVLAQGCIVGAGTAAALRADPAVARAYLGAG